VFRSVTLKLSSRLQARIRREARQKRKSPERWMLDAIERELERRERFIAYVQTAQRAGLASDPVSEVNARQQVRFWLDQLAAIHPGGKVTRLKRRRPLRSSG
jgi:predicted transcriptional regulator